MAQKIKEVSVIEPIWRSIDNPLIIKQRKVIVQYEILINALWDKAASGSLPAIKAIVNPIARPTARAIFEFSKISLYT